MMIIPDTAVQIVPAPLLQEATRGSSARSSHPDWFQQVAAGLDEPHAVILRFGDDLPRDQVLVAARVVMEDLIEVIRARDCAPREMYLEVDHLEHGTPLTPGFMTRLLLPHTDGAHYSFLTPSRQDVPEFPASFRIFSKKGFHRTASHKLYQGFLIVEPGSSVSWTLYYDLFPALLDAYAFQHGSRPSNHQALQQWVAANIGRSLSMQDRHGSRYLSLAALLGSENAVHHVTPPGPRAEAGFAPREYAHFPELERISRQCPCRSCAGPGARLLCDGLQATMGIGWKMFRDRYERRIRGRKNDVLIAHNIFLYHGAESGAADRVLLPMCFVMNEAGGDEYEVWSARQWQRQFVRAQSLNEPHRTQPAENPQDTGLT